MSRPIKRSFQIRGHRTSLSLEEPFWDALKEIAADKKLPLAQLVETIDTGRNATASGLSGAIRLYILDYYRQRARAEPK